MATIKDNIPKDSLVLTNTTNTTKVYGQFVLEPNVSKLVYDGDNMLLDKGFNDFVKAFSDGLINEGLRSGEITGLLNNRTVPVNLIINVTSQFLNASKLYMVTEDDIWRYNGDTGLKPLIYEIPPKELDEQWSDIIDVNVFELGELIIEYSFIADAEIRIRFVDDNGTTIGSTFIGRNGSFFIKANLPLIKIQARTEQGVHDLEQFTLKLTST